ncbi:TIGR03546 family protein [Alteromonadaceae bacterium Bs31]|nr:TIGR03546 family protein [Alteromonadaceae bacterium Bs31]
MNYIVKFLKAISSETNPWQIAFALVLGMIFGLSPLWRLHNVLILFVVLVFRVNVATFLVSLGVFSALAFALDPLMLQLGERLLLADGLQQFWTALYNSPLGLLSQFNHTLTMGSLVSSLLAAPFVLFLSKYLIVKYRSSVMERVNKMHIVKVLKASTLFQKFSGLEG